MLDADTTTSVAVGAHSGGCVTAGATAENEKRSGVSCLAARALARGPIGVCTAATFSAQGKQLVLVRCVMVMGATQSY